MVGIGQWCWVTFSAGGILLVWIMMEKGPTVLEVGTGGGCLDIFFLLPIISHFLLLSGG